MGMFGLKKIRIRKESGKRAPDKKKDEARDKGKDKGKPKAGKKEEPVKSVRPGFRTRFSFRKDVIGKVWFRLDYFDKRLTGLDEEKQKTFLDNYMQSTRQLNFSIVIIIIFMIIAYIIYSVGIFSMVETGASWIILLYLLFYLARRHRIDNEQLLKYLMDTEMTPDYARYPKKR